MTTAPPLSDDAISTPAPPPAPSLAQTTVPTPVAPSRRIVIIAWIALIIAVLSWSVMGPSFVFLNRKNVFPILAVVWRNSCVLLFTLLPALYQVISATPEQRRSWFARQPLSKTEEDTDLECVADAAAFVARARIQTQTQAQQEALAATAAAPVHGDDDEEEGAVYIMPMSPRHAAPTPAAAGLHGAAFARAGTPARVSTPARVGAPSRAAVYSPTPSPVLATREVGAAAAAVAAGSGSGASAGDAEAASPRPPVTLLTRSASTASVASSTAESVSHRGPMSPTTAGVAAAVGAARLRGPTPPPSPFSPMSPTGTAAGARALMPSPSSDSGSAPMTGQAALAVPVKVTVPVYERLPPGYAYTIPACAPVPAAAAAAAAGLTVGSGGFMQLGDALEPSDAPLSTAAGDASGVGSAADVSALSSTDATAVMGGSSPSFAPANTTTTTTVTVSMPVLVPAPIPVQGSEIELVLELPPGDVTTTTDAPTAGASAGALEGVEYNVVTATLEPVPVPNKDASAIITAHFAAAVAANVNAQRAAARAGFPATSSEPVETVDQPCPAPAPPLGTVPFSAGACEWAEATDDALVTHFSAITAAISGLVVAVTAPVLSACGSACAASRVPAAARSCDRGWARAAGALRSAMPASWDWVWQAAGCDAFSRAGVAAGAAEGRGEYEDVGDIEMGAMGGSRPAAPMGPSMSRAQSDVSVANGADQGSLAALGSRETDSAAAVPADGPVKKTLSQHWNEAMERPMFVCVITGILWGMNVSTWVTALRFVTTVIASLLGSMSPVFIICYYLATAAPISRGELGGTAAAVAGVIACLGSSMFSGEETRDVENNSMAASGPIYALFGGLLALTCSACVAIDTVITARARKHVPIFVWIITSLFVSTVFCALLTLAIENTSVFGLGRTSIMGFLDPSILPTVMFLGFIGGLVGLVGYKFSIAYISPLVHTVTQLMDPMLTGIISYYLGYESAPTWPVYVGGSIIVLGIAGLVVGEFYRAQKNRRFVRALRAYAEGEAELVMAAAVGEGGCCGSVAMVGEKGVVEVQVNGKAFY